MNASPAPAPVILDGEALKARYAEYKSANPKSRIRDAATALGVAEAQLLATGVGEGVTRLAADDWSALLQQFPRLGRVMSLTRNAQCVLEHKGTFDQIDIHHHGKHVVGTVIGPIETRVFFYAWKYGFAVSQPGMHGKLMHSLQFFDAAGDAITKIYVQNDEGLAVFDELVAQYRAADQSTTQAVDAPPAMETLPPDGLDLDALRHDWANLQDTHDFFGMLRKHKASRFDAVRLVGTEFCEQIALPELEPMLRKAAETQLPIMIFAGNRGNIQIHQDVVSNIQVMGPWLNVMDPDFNMHLKTEGLHSAWIVRKPTADGVVTGIEVFDEAAKEMVVQFFGLRKPGIPEREAWRELVATLQRV